jgi:hypothetical protein
MCNVVFAEIYNVVIYTQGSVTTKTKKYSLPKVVSENTNGAYYQWTGNGVTITVSVDEKSLSKVQKEIEKDKNIKLISIKVIHTPTVTATVTK